jgi:caffeoyl-CoA O-methyltransferase
MLKLLSNELEAYVQEHTTPETEVLSKLNRETNAKILMPQMLSGHIQGRILAMLSKLISPNRILEIGTYTGYAAICMAEGLKENGRLHTIDINEELEEMVHQYICAANMENKIVQHIGDAVQIIPELNESFDMVFIDADKANYSNYFDLVIDKVRKGGLIIADNVLWSGKVLEARKDKDTRAIVAFNKKVNEDNRVENLLLPVRDGLMLLRKV